LHPSYLATIFADKINKNSIQSVQRFERQERRSNRVVNIDNHIEMEQHNCQDIVTTNVSKVNYRSITCQTDETNNISNKATYFFCNLNYHDGINIAEVQVNIALKKTVRSAMLIYRY